ncbi:uncharacterized protein K452DRAFT_359533 [Aplosporella prunicola CBS 121167]|uniref:Uncharacterized protein n=1 Tax=Aplosporella prunicola CBS 121167 TaxID=1176127 RepID=A0A6A6BB36_9PEZI|nr:uncharacterized protein K452DRAFT_359533 [Aplosporella prunicola CBS 121167]KAF2140455.1 hypothetical protein K452DRAFT_359533 [Aplosporella prunicola CBS 121167]
MFFIETRAVYSVVATERSFVRGVSRLEKRLFARMLTNKTLKRKLPAEIAEIVEDDLFDHYWAPTAKSWERVDDLWRRKHPALYWERFMTENAMRAWGTLADSLGLVLAARGGPYDNLLTDNNWRVGYFTDPFFVHISRFGHFTHGDIGLHFWSLQADRFKEIRDNERQRGISSTYDYNITRLRSGICSTALDEKSGTVNAYFVAQNGAEHKTNDRVERFMELEGVEEAMKSWDGEAMEKCIKILGLDMVGTKRGGDELKPRLRVVQSFASDSSSFR